MKKRNGHRWRLERYDSGRIALYRRGNNLGEPVAVFHEGEEATAERVLAMLNTFEYYDSPGSPTYGPIREAPAVRNRHEGPYFPSNADPYGG